MVYKKQIKKSTLDVYEKNYNKLSKDINGDILDEFKWLLDFEKVMKEINKSPSPHTRKNKINTVVIYINMIDDLKKTDEEILRKYNNEIIELSKLISNNYNKNEMNDKQKENWISYEELINLLNQLKEDLPKKIIDNANYKKLMYYLMLSVHLELPLRNDLSDAKLYLIKDFNKLEEEPQLNYIVLDKNKGFIILNNYKTSGSYGRKKINMSKELYNIFKKYYSVIKEQTKDDYIFIDKDKEKLTRNGYTLLFNNLFKSLGVNKKISSSMIRHIVISHKFPINKNEMEEREQLAGIMGHSVNEALKVYSKDTTN
jgi:hypothetical protein